MGGDNNYLGSRYILSIDICVSSFCLLFSLIGCAEYAFDVRYTGYTAYCIYGLFVMNSYFKKY